MGEYRFTDFADDAVSLGASWDLLVGHSLGGAIAVVALRKYPNLATRAILIDPALQLRPEASGPFLQETLNTIANIDPPAIAAANPNWHPRTIQARIDSYREVDAGAVTAIVEGNQPWDVLADAAQLAVPVHVIAADPAKGASFSAAVGDRLHAANPQWTYEVVPGASHSVHRDCPQLVIDRVLAPR
jgi:pimeloyl-ACP methyl ester carboxylesterase